MSEVVLCCPLPGPPPEFSGDCESTKSHTWASSGLGELYYYVPFTNLQIVSFDFYPVSNNGSNITIQIFYYRDGVGAVQQTWDLGELPTNEKVYHILNFGANNNINNSFELRIIKNGGTSGEFTVYFDCDPQVQFFPFCTAFTYNEESKLCGCEGDTVILYAEKDILKPQLPFPFLKANNAWYLDADLQIPAPCGNYMTASYGQQMIYTYNCTTLTSTLYGLCDDCTLISCSAATKYDVYTHTGYTLSNPYIPKAQDIQNNGLYLYSEQCTAISLTPNDSDYKYLTIQLSYTGNCDSALVTLSDPNAPLGQSGFLSYSETVPSQSTYFTMVTPQTLIKVLPNETKTIYVVPPKTRVVKVRFMVGHKLNSLNRNSVNSKVEVLNCGTSFSGFTCGLHTYSAWDSIINPRLTTDLFALAGTPLTWTVGTIVFADRYLTQPAFPYFYGYSGDGSTQKVIKVGTLYAREWGTKKYYVSSQKKFQYKLDVRIEPYQDWTHIVDNEKRVPNCIDPVMDIGKITSITPLGQVKQPATYSYLLGYSPTTKSSSNDEFFFRTQFIGTLKKTGTKKPLTGYEFALWRNSEAIAAGWTKYVQSFDEAVMEKTLETRGRNISRGIAWGSMAIGAGLAVLTLLNPGGLAMIAASLVTFALGKLLNKFTKTKVGSFLNGALSGLGAISKLLGKAKKSAGSASTAYSYPGNNGGFLKKIGRFLGLSKKWTPPDNLDVGKGASYDCPPPVDKSAPKGGNPYGFFFDVWLQLEDRLYQSGYTKTYRPQCVDFYTRYTDEPYIFLNETLYKYSGMTGRDTGYYCDGAYFYTVAQGPSSYVTQKEQSYKTENGVKTISPLPDVPNKVVQFDLLAFLPFVSGKPDTWVFPHNFYSDEVTGDITPPIKLIGELNNPLDIEFNVPAGKFYSDVSQEDADNQAIDFFTGYTAATITQIASFESKPGVEDEQLNFSHELRLEDEPNATIVGYQSLTNTGIQLGTKLYYDIDGSFSCLKGYYSTVDSGIGYYKKFFQVNTGGTIDDVYVMQNEGDNYVISEVTSEVVALSQNYLDYTSAWYFKSDDIQETYFNIDYNIFNFNDIWGTSEFYSHPVVVRGFMSNNGDNDFQIYNSNTDNNAGHSNAEESFYRVMTTNMIFPYVRDYVIIIDFEQLCAVSGDTGVMFKLKDISGNTTPSIYGITFNVDLYVGNLYNSTHEITIGTDETETLLVLDPIYQGNLTDIVITEYLSFNPINTIYFTGGTFTPCGQCEIIGSAEVEVPVTPTPTPSATVLYVATTASNACSSINGITVPTFTFSGGSSICSCVSVSGPNFSSLSLGSYYISDGYNSRLFNKFSLGATMVASGSCTLCTGVSPTPTPTLTQTPTPSLGSTYNVRIFARYYYTPPSYTAKIWYSVNSGLCGTSQTIIDITCDEYFNFSVNSGDIVYFGTTDESGSNVYFNYSASDCPSNTSSFCGCVGANVEVLANTDIYVSIANQPGEQPQGC